MLSIRDIYQVDVIHSYFPETLYQAESFLSVLMLENTLQCRKWCYYDDDNCKTIEDEKLCKDSVSAID